MSIQIIKVPAATAFSWLKQAVQLFLLAPHISVLPSVLFLTLLSKLQALQPIAANLVLAWLLPGWYLIIYYFSQQLGQQRQQLGLAFASCVNNAWLKLTSNVNNLLILGCIYAPLNLGLYFASEHLMQQVRAQLAFLILEDNTINIASMPNLSLSTPLLLALLSLISVVLQFSFACATVFISETKSTVLKSLFFATYLVKKNLWPILVFMLSLSFFLLITWLFFTALGGIALTLISPLVTLVILVIPFVSIYFIIRSCVIFTQPD